MYQQQDVEATIGKLKIVAARDGEVESLLNHNRWTPGDHPGPVLVLGPDGAYLSGISIDLWLAIVSHADELASPLWNYILSSGRATYTYRSTLPHSWYPHYTWWYFYGYDFRKLAHFVIARLQVEGMV